MIARLSDEELSDGFADYTVPAATWAVFPCTAQTIGKTEAIAITKWFPESQIKTEHIRNNLSIYQNIF